MRLPSTHNGRVTGFTLVEMAIVLVIIGIILAGVMKGRDIVRGSQVKQFSQGFAQKWVTIASTYYDKVGQHLADGTDNGGTNNNVDGQMDNIQVEDDDQGSELLQALRDVGITPCTMIKSDLKDDASTGGVTCNNTYNIWARTIEGEWTGKVRVDVGFFFTTVDDSNISSNRNTVLVYNTPADVAQGLDTLIDGQADGTVGACVNFTDPDDDVAPDDDTADPTGASPNVFDWPAQDDNARKVTVGLILDY